MISIQIIVIELIKKDVFLSKATYKINSEDIRSYSICIDNSSYMSVSLCIICSSIENFFWNWTLIEL